MFQLVLQYNLQRGIAIQLLTQVSHFSSFQTVTLLSVLQGTEFSFSPVHRTWAMMLSIPLLTDQRRTQRPLTLTFVSVHQSVSIPTDITAIHHAFTASHLEVKLNYVKIMELVRLINSNSQEIILPRFCKTLLQLV